MADVFATQAPSECRRAWRTFSLHWAHLGLQNHGILQPMPWQISVQFLVILRRIRRGQNEFAKKIKNKIDTHPPIQVKTTSSVLKPREIKESGKEKPVESPWAFQRKTPLIPNSIP
jgi:hypothetical protein